MAGHKWWRERKEMHRQRTDLAQFAAELYGFVVNELDPDPHPAAAYVTSPEAQRVAHIVQRLAYSKGLIGLMLAAEVD